MNIISQGAEAVLEREGDFLFKKRISKTYRAKELDVFLRKTRSKREFKVLQKVFGLGINVPKVYPSEDSFVIKMDFIDGIRLRDFILSGKGSGLEELKLLGSWMAILHENFIIHGDLTTSNVLVDKEGSLFLIDFGLSFSSGKVEDMAVDIHLLEQALESTHYLVKESLFNSFLEGYAKFSKYDLVMDRLSIVRSRGRNKH